MVLPMLYNDVVDQECVVDALGKEVRSERNRGMGRGRRAGGREGGFGRVWEGLGGFGASEGP